MKQVDKIRHTAQAALAMSGADENLISCDTSSILLRQTQTYCFKQHHLSTTLKAICIVVQAIMNDKKTPKPPIDFNRDDIVNVREDDGSVSIQTVKYEPWQLGDGTWVVALRGRPGGFLLDRITLNRRGRVV